MCERFTDRVRKVFKLANQEAQRCNHQYFGTEHILLGLIKAGRGVGTYVLRDLDVDLDRARDEVERLIIRGPDIVILGKLPLTPGVKNVIEYSLEEARNLKHDFVGTEHILLGLLREREGVAAQVLMSLGVTLEGAREGIVNLIGHGIEKNERETQFEMSEVVAARISFVARVLSVFGFRAKAKRDSDPL